MQVNIQEAETHFSRLLERVEQGESIVIARQGKPVAELIPLRKKRIPLGIAKGEPLVPPGDEWWQPMSDQEAEDWISGR